MKVFISWSKERSLRVATALNEWLPQVINQVEPWMSAESMESGRPSIAQITEALETTNFGIICVTPENQHETWLNFEAGALAKAVTSASARAIPLLVGFGNFSELDAPLSNYQAQMSTKTDLKKIVHALNAALGTDARPVTQLETAFEKWWPDLETELVAAEKWTIAEPKAIQDTSVDKRFDQIIQAVKTLQRQVEELTETVRTQPGSNAKREALIRMLNEGQFTASGLHVVGITDTEHEQLRKILAAAGHDASTLMLGVDGMEIKTHEPPSMATRLEVQDFMNASQPGIGKILFSTYDSDESPSHD
ncbi:TIR domain-containing protein [Arthrobacter sp. MDT3-24]